VTTLLVLVAGTAMLLAAIWGSRPNSAFAQFLASPSPCERRFQQPQSNLSEEAKETQVPLIKAAKAFSLYLNPPAKPTPAPRPGAATDAHASVETKMAAATPEVRPAVSSPQFQLQGISYHRSKPEMSMALVWQPDTGRRWVRQGTQLGHLVIEQISSDAIVYRDGQLTHELALKLDATSMAVAQQDKGKVSPARPGERPPSAPPATTPQRAGLRSAVALPASVPGTHPAPSKSVARAIAAERRRWAKIPYSETVAERDKRAK
jgi:hypothetical protein